MKYFDVQSQKKKTGKDLIKGLIQRFNVKQYIFNSQSYFLENITNIQITIGARRGHSTDEFDLANQDETSTNSFKF